METGINKFVIFKMRKIAVILLHLGYWVMYIFLLFVIFVLSAASQDDFDTNKTAFFINWIKLVTAFAITPGVLGFYAGYTILYNRYLAKRKIASLFLSGIVSSIIAGAVGVILMLLLNGIDIMFVDGWNSAIPEFILMCFIAALNCIIGLVLKGFITAYSDIKWKEELNKKNYEMELAMVKSQINPHFLFNTLNNIDALILKDQVAASNYLNKLSDILRYMLYETKTEKIALAKELLYMEKYIELQKIRTSNTNAIQLVIEGEVADRMIEPLLFIPFLENAFKHTQFLAAENSVDIKFVIEETRILFICKNYINTGETHKQEFGGLGMALISKRLLLLYPDKHVLDIKSKNNIYEVTLSIYENENELHHHRE